MYLGFDTSNYTTSVSAFDGETAVNKRRIIPVKEGQRGIRQSEGVFEHVRAMPRLYEELDIHNVRAVGASVRPRNAEGSYMPVFLTGECCARAAAKTAGVPFYAFSHQDGHIAAGILSGGCEELLCGEFLTAHISGGTTEIIKCRFNSHNFDTEIIGGTRDISAGQLIDRAGVYMGMPFPAGKYMEKSAEGHNKTLKMPVSVTGTQMNFSGTENKVMEYIKTESESDVAFAVLRAVADTLVRALVCAAKSTGMSRALIVGGVASNEYIRARLKDGFCGKMYFASRELSSDNAAGIAYLTYLNERNKNGK